MFLWFKNSRKKFLWKTNRIEYQSSRVILWKWENVSKFSPRYHFLWEKWKNVIDFHEIRKGLKSIFPVSCWGRFGSKSPSGVQTVYSSDKMSELRNRPKSSSPTQNAFLHNFTSFNPSKQRMQKVCKSLRFLKDLYSV